MVGFMQAKITIVSFSFQPNTSLFVFSKQYLKSPINYVYVVLNRFIDDEFPGHEVELEEKYKRYVIPSGNINKTAIKSTIIFSFL